MDARTNADSAAASSVAGCESVPVVTIPTLTAASPDTACSVARRSRSAARLAVSSPCSGNRTTNADFE